MEEENSDSSERSSTSSEDSAPYFPHYSSHATNPINSQEEEESSDDHRTKHQSLKKIESAPYLTPSSSEFSPLCPPKTLSKQAAPKLTNFSFLLVYESELKTRLDRWVRFATTGKVDRLSLRSSSSYIKPYGYTLPQHLYADEFVSELDFHFCEIKPNGLVGRSSLKRLCIGIKDVSTLIEVKLNFELLVKYESVEEDACKEHQDIVKELLQSLHHIKNLTVGKWCLMLEFTLDFTIDNNFDHEKYWKSQNRAFGCLSRHLKTVEIVGFEAKCFGLKCLTGLVQFPLKHARVLEKVIYGKAKASNQTPTLLEACRLLKLE
uniref:FBD domain-containing protein n=1 Tax=Quercus lobata TaxID=97700 RepID=A0A7N2LEJ2_QUELO